MGVRNFFGKRLRSLSAAVDESIRSFFWAFGAFVARWPWLCILMPVAISLFFGICGVGYNFAQEKASAELYAEKGSPSVYDRQFMIHTFGFTPIEERVLVANKTGSYPNLLEPDSIKGNLMELMEIWEKMENTTLGNPMSNFQNLCEKAGPGKPCKIHSILAAWNYSMAILENDSDPLATINAAESSLLDNYGRPMDLSFLLGGIERNEKGEIISGRAFHMQFRIRVTMDAFEKKMFDKMRAAGKFKHMENELKGRESLLAQNFDPRGYLINHKLVDEINDWENAEGTKLDPTVWNVLEVERESDESIDKTLVWILLSVVLVAIYTNTVLFRNNWTYCKAHLVAVCFISIFLALASAIGMALLLGVKFNLVVRSIPFLLIGLGVDDTFIILGQFQRTDERLNPVDRIGQAMSRAGASIFVTSLTNLIAFMLAMASRIPAMRAFGAYAALGIAFNFIYQVTFFLGFVVFEARREHRMRNGESLFGFIKRRKVTANSSESDGSETIKPAQQVMEIEVVEMGCSNGQLQNTTTQQETTEASHQPPPSPPFPTHLKKIFGKAAFDPTTPTFTRHLFSEKIPEAILSSPGSAAILVIEIGILALALYGCTGVHMNFEFREWFTPHSSQLHDAYSIEKKFFFGDQTNFGLYSKAGDYFGNQDEMMKMVEVVRESKFVAETPRAESWYEDYSEWLLQSDHKSELINSRAPNKTAFISWLNEYLTTEQGGYYMDHIKFTDATMSDIATTKLVNFYSVDLTKGYVAVEMIAELREAAKKTVPDLDPMVYNVMSPFYDGLRVIKHETVRNVVFAGAAVFVICSITLANVSAAGIVLLMIGLTDVMLFGFMWYIGLTFNMVTSINILLAVGVAVDYSAHVMHSFLSTQGTKKERAQKALENIGGEVFAGGFTTLLAVIGLAPANHYVLNVFFQMFTMIVVFGLWHGLIVLPVVLMYIGPDAYIKDDGSDDQADVEQPN